MEEDTQDKIFKRVRVTGTTSDVLSTITTSTNTSGLTKSYTSDTDNAKYDISSTDSGRKGKWIQMEITNSSSDIESIGVVYRKRTSVK